MSALPEDSPTSPTPIGSGEARLLHRAIKDMGEHVFEAIGGLAADHAKLSESVARIEARLDKMNSSIPPMRPELDSAHNLGEFAHKVEQAAIEGYRRQDSTPEELVAKVVEEAEERRAQAAELKRLQKVEADGIAERARIAEEQARARRDRARFLRNLALAAAGGGGAFTGIVEGIRAILAAHH